MKPKQPNEKIVASLENLKQELLLKKDNLYYRELLFKINSCLFSEYHHGQRS